MKIEGSVQELELFFKKFNLLEKTEITIDSTKVGDLIIQELKQNTNDNLPKYNCINNLLN